MAAGVFVRRLYEHMPNDWCVDVLCPDDGEGVVPESTTQKVTAVRYAPRAWQRIGQRHGGILPALRKNRWLLLLVPGFLGALAFAVLRHARNADVIHANWSISGAIAIAIGSLTRKGVVTTLRGEDATAASAPWARPLLSICLRYSDAIVCVSTPMAGVLLRLYPRHASKIFVIHNGVDAGLFGLERPEAHSDRLRILAIGSLIHRKGFDVLIRAMGKMKANCSVDLVIAGDGPERKRLDALAASLPPSRRVSWLGEVPPERVPELLSAADVLVLSSRSEGRPNVVLEALAAGMPVVSTRLPGVSDLVVDGVTGWLSDVDDVTSMAKALDAASDAATRISLGKAARLAAIARNETWGLTAEKYARLFRSVINRRTEFA